MDITDVEARWNKSVEFVLEKEYSIRSLENWLARRPEGLSGFTTPARTVMHLETISDYSIVCPNWRIELTIHKTDDGNIKDFNVSHRNECSWFP